VWAGEEGGEGEEEVRMTNQKRGFSYFILFLLFYSFCTSDSIRRYTWEVECIFGN
jgi:hypothetical protein